MQTEKASVQEDTLSGHIVGSCELIYTQQLNTTQQANS